MAMNRELVIVSVQPQRTDFIWQLKVQLENLKKYDLLKYYHVIFYVEKAHKPLEDIIKLNMEYPEAKFFFYHDSKDECLKLILGFNYIPILRPWCLKQHFKANPELEKAAILYIDSDVIFTKDPVFLKDQSLLDDEINYLSNTKSYIAASYFDKKVEGVKESKLSDYNKIDVLNHCAEMVGINRKICEENENNTGGAQYLLKNVDWKFWADVVDGCLFIFVYLRNINQAYMKGEPGKEREDNGFQSWCADMWSVLWNIWKRGGVTRTPEFMDFVWCTDPIEDIEKKYIYHDAGVGENLFDKRKYQQSIPFTDDFSWVDKTKASYFYVQQFKSFIL